MKKEVLIKKCRYYNGSDTFKGFAQNLMYWEAEKMYVENYGTQVEADAIKFYLSCGLAGTSFTIPLGLCAFLFSVYCKGSDNAPDVLALYFKDSAFLTNYLAQPL